MSQTDVLCFETDEDVSQLMADLMKMHGISSFSFRARISSGANSSYAIGGLIGALHPRVIISSFSFIGRDVLLWTRFHCPRSVVLFYTKDPDVVEQVQDLMSRGVTVRTKVLRKPAANILVLGEQIRLALPAIKRIVPIFSG